VEKINVNNLQEFQTFRTELRKRLIPSEAAFWNIVKSSNLDGLKFRRQHSVGKYILDFYCPSERLAVDLDGEGHYGVLQEIHDNERKRFLRYFGIKVIRFENEMVFEEPVCVVERIRASFGWKSRSPE